MSAAAADMTVAGTSLHHLISDDRRSARRSAEDRTGSRNILIASVHPVLEYDEIEIFEAMGHRVFSLGFYTRRSEARTLRPPLPETDWHRRCLEVLQTSGCRKDAAGPQPWKISREFAALFDLIIVHHDQSFIEVNWPVIAEIPVIWRSIGQGYHWTENAMRPVRESGVMIVRWSEVEEQIPGYAGADAVIRASKKQEDWCGWTGTTQRVITFNNNFRARGDNLNFNFHQQVVAGLPFDLYGLGNEDVSDWRGTVSYSEQQTILRNAKVVFVTGTAPAPYTLGFVEAWMTGTPTVHVGCQRVSGGKPGMYEIDRFITDGENGFLVDEVDGARRVIGDLLNDPALAQRISARGREAAIGIFGRDRAMREWQAFFQAHLKWPARQSQDPLHQNAGQNSQTVGRAPGHLPSARAMQYPGPPSPNAHPAMGEPLQPSPLSIREMLRVRDNTRISWAAFDPDWYLQTYRITRETLPDTDPTTLLHWYLDHGQPLHHAPNPFFDESFFRAHHPAAAAAVHAGQAESGFDAYCRTAGHYRRPHWLFDEALYRERNPDLTDEALVAHSLSNGYHHYLHSGSKEGRSGSLFFDNAVYLAHLPRDQAAEAQATGPFLHYLSHLFQGGMLARTSLHFDPDWYLQRYPEVAEAVSAGAWRCPLHHYLANDMPTRFDPLAEFSEEYYLTRYPDVHAAVTDGRLHNGYEHYLRAGARELRSPCEGFDPRYYVDAHRSVRADLERGAAPHPFAHYLAIGRAQDLATIAQPKEAVTEGQTKALFVARATLLHGTR